MKYLALTFFCLAALGLSAIASDLYQVSVNSRAEAEFLNALEVTPVLRVSGGYLVIANSEAARAIEASQIAYEMLAIDVKLSELALDQRLDRKNADLYPVVYEAGSFRLFRTDPSLPAEEKGRIELLSVDNSYLRIEYQAPLKLNPAAMADPAELGPLVDMMSQDSVEAVMLRLEAFNGRLTGTDSCNAAEEWIKGKFESYGYDSVYFDSFPCQLFPPIEGFYGRNVVAVKVGTRFPNRHVIIGGHHDTVWDCPGADDNGSGTTGVLEIARVLAGVATEMTVIFITFDVEEQGIYGAKHYVEEAVARGDSIMVMYNMDMIGHYENDTEAWVEPDPQVAYGELWIHYADSLCGITATPDLQSAGDYYYFRQAGYNVCAMQEKIFSTHYHSPSDSTTYINMDYLTRMITTTMASIYTIAASLPPISTTWVQNVGDGQSVRVNWEPTDMSEADHYCVYYSPVGMPGADSMVVSADSISYIIDGLTEDWEYGFRVVATDTYGTSSIASAAARCVPSQLPALPPEQHALPIHNGVKLYWAANDELDFDHYGIVRDGQMVAKPHYDSVFHDTDPSLGTEFHDYLAVAFDADGHMCDTVGASTVSMKIAALTDQKILAVNRSSDHDGYHVIVPDSTGAFMVEALDGLDFVYAADTAFRTKTTCLLDLTDYGLVVVGAESARWDDIADYWSGFLDTLEYYLSIGGKAVVFGRWGNISLDVYPPEADSVWYGEFTYAHRWTDAFNIEYRVQPMTTTTGSWTLISDFIGGHTQSLDYPELVWDSLATAGNTPAPYVILSGVPAASYPSFVTPEDVEVIYTYNSSTDWYLSEGQPAAWRYVGGTYDYIHFDIPLSFMERTPAVAALRQAAEDLGIVLPEHCCTGIRGNANGDLEDKANISDITYLIDYLFGIPGGPPPDCMKEGNANGDLEEKVNISDITYLVTWLFGIPSGPAPPACP